MSINEKETKIEINSEENEEILSIPPDSTNIEDYEIKDKTICDFIIKEKLGEGTFGKVRLGINRQTEEKVAIKILDKKRITKERDKKRLEKEIKILKSLRHPNIVYLYADIQNNSNIYLITEYIKGTELLHYISSSSKLTEEEACFYFRQIISSIEYLHKLKISHRDIKPENMIIEDSTKNIKLIDFGLSSYYNTKSEMLSSACGSPSYAPPEMLSGKKYNAVPIDIWSCGIVLYAMICGYLPFDDPDQDILFKKIKEGKFKLPTHLSENAKDLIKHILVVDPKKRYTIDQIKKHKWFKLCLNNETYRNKKSLYEGLLLNKYVVPLDEEIINKMNIEYKIKKDRIRICLLNNEHNDITTLYYLILLKNTKEEKESIADLKGNLFKKYLEDNKNLLSNYDNDINKVIEERKNIKEDYINNHNQIEDKENEDKNQNEEIINIKLEQQDNNNNEKIKTNINIDNNIINNNLNIDNIDNNIIDNNIINSEKINNENNIEKKELVQKENNKKTNKNKINNEKKIYSPEKIKETLKLIKMNNLNKKTINSASRREYNKKLNKLKINEIIHNNKNKAKSKDKIKNISKKENMKIIVNNPIKEKIKESKKNDKNDIIKKPKIINKESDNKKNKIKEIKTELKDNDINNINKSKKQNTYRPNTIHVEKKIIPNKEDKVNKTITITNKNKATKRITKSAEKRNINKYNKPHLKIKQFSPNIKTNKNCISATSRPINNKKKIITINKK